MLPSTEVTAVAGVERCELFSSLRTTPGPSIICKQLNAEVVKGI